MAFRPVNFENGKLRQVPAANSIAFVKGAALIDNGSGYVDLSTSGSTEVLFVAAETLTTTSTGQLLLVWDVDGVQFDADCDAAAAQTDVGTKADLATNSTINPDAASNDVFQVEQIGGALADAVVRGKFIRKTS